MIILLQTKFCLLIFQNILVGAPNVVEILKFNITFLKNVEIRKFKY